MVLKAKAAKKKPRKAKAKAKQHPAQKVKIKKMTSDKSEASKETRDEQPEKETRDNPDTKHPGLLDPQDVKEHRDFSEALHQKIAVVGDPNLKSILFDLVYGDTEDNPSSEGYGEPEQPATKPQPRK